MAIREKISGAASKANPFNTSKEQMSAGNQFAAMRAGSMSLKGGEFIDDIYNEEILTPHEEMRAGYRMLHNDPQVASAIGTRVDLIMGRKLGVKTDDDATQEYFNEEVMPKLKQPLRNALRDMSITGNGFVRIIRGQNTGVPMDFEEVQRPHKVYIKFKENSFEIDKYIIETRGTQKGETFDVRYYDGRRKTVRGISVDSEDMIHFREGSGVVPKYGRSDFLSAVDSYKIKREMMRSQAVIARQKSIPRKLVKINGEEGGGNVDVPQSGTTDEQKQQVESELSKMSDYQNPILYDTEVEVEDFDYDPSIGENQDVIKQLSKEIVSSMPQYLTNPEDSNRATAKEEKQTIQLRMSSVRDNVSAEVNTVLQEVAEENGYDTKVGIQFGDFDFPTREEKLENAQILFSKGVITRNEARNMLDIEEVGEEQDGFADDVTDQDIGSTNDSEEE